ncbi:acyl-CoA dehydrogenase family protein [Arthrobacter sp. UYP6]|uniref:acyl-CoA dehydrogenase family protein n=1 Tax=Arthrobacter sp. UYP6 TaxID=1756378 RepID=UPI003397BE7C
MSAGAGEALPENTPDTRTSPESRYQNLAARFRPVFARIAAGSLDRELTRTLPFEPVQWLKDAGFGAVRLPAGAGGDGASHAEFFRLLVELAEADSNVAHLLRSHFAFVETIGREDAGFRKRWYARVAAGEIFGNAATERSGNALGTTNTKLRPGVEGWVLDGEKYYTTGSIFADWIAVMATTDGVPGRQYAVVPVDREGVRIVDDWDGFGQQHTGTGTTYFRQVHVPARDVIPRGAADTTLEAAFFQLVLLAVLAGIGRAAVRDAAALVRGRKRTFNTGSGSLFRDDPLIQQLVGRLSAKAATAEAMVLAAAVELDAAVDPALDLTPEQGYLRTELAVDRAQITVPELVLDVAQGLFDVTGASAVSTTKALDRHWRNARTVATHNPAVFKARGVGDWEINGTVPQGLGSIGDAPAGPAPAAPAPAVVP